MLICGLLSISVMASNDMLLVDDLSEEHLEARALIQPLSEEIQGFIQEARERIMISLAPRHVTDFPTLRAGPNPYIDVWNTWEDYQKKQEGAQTWVGLQLLGAVCKEIEGEIVQTLTFANILDHLKKKRSLLCKNEERLKQAFMLGKDLPLPRRATLSSQ